MGTRIDALDATATPSRGHEVPAMDGGTTVRLSVDQILGLIDAGDVQTGIAAATPDDTIDDADEVLYLSSTTLKRGTLTGLISSIFKTARTITNAQFASATFKLFNAAGPPRSLSFNTTALTSDRTRTIADKDIDESKLPLITRLSSVATTSGTAFDFAIDPDATEIKVDLGQVQLSGNDTMLVQLGTSGGVVSAGYDQMAFMQVAASATLIASTAGFVVSGSTTARYANGILTLRRIGSSNRWAASYSAGNSVSMFVGGGSVDLGASVTQLRLTRSGSNTFAAGIAGVEYRT